jgi:hypothetical protein
MSNNFKALGLAIVAMLAMSAVVTSAASAQATTAKLTAMDNVYPKTWYATNSAGQETLTTEAGTVECASTFSGSIAGATQEFTVNPVYSGCKAFGFLNATVAMEGCSYRLKITTTLTSPTHHYQVHSNVVCPAGKAIKITAGTCVVTIGAQTGLTTADLENNAATTDILFRPTKGKTNYTVVTDGFGCPFAGTGVKTDGTYTSHSATTITSSGGAIHIG